MSGEAQGAGRPWEGLRVGIKSCLVLDRSLRFLACPCWNEM